MENDDIQVYWRKKSSNCPKELYGILLKATIITHDKNLCLIFDDSEELIEFQLTLESNIDKMFSLLINTVNEKNRAMIKTQEHPLDAYNYINKK